MARIGAFKAAVRAADPDREPDTFTLEDVEFTISPEVNIIALGRFARAARDGGDSDDMEGLAALIDTVSSLVIDEDQNRFLDVASKHRVDGDLLMEIIKAVLESQSGHPTQRPSDSSDGSSTTTPSSRALSSSEVSSVPSWVNTPFGRRELAANPELYADFTDVSHVDMSQLV
jgi:hypothetical protein